MTLGGTFKPGYESQVVTSGRSHKSGCEPAEGNIHKHGYEATHKSAYVTTTNKIFFHQGELPELRRRGRFWNASRKVNRTFINMDGVCRGEESPHGT